MLPIKGLPGVLDEKTMSFRYVRITAHGLPLQAGSKRACPHAQSEIVCTPR